MTAASDVLHTPAPSLDDEAARALLADAWATPAATLQRLGSERDANLLVNGAFVLKVSNPAEDRDVVDMEVAALAHIHRVAPDLPVPETVPTTAGHSVAAVVDSLGRRCPARLITVLPGSDLEGTPITADLAGQVGAMAARIQLALRGFFHPAAGRTIGWDVRRLPELVAADDPLMPLVERVRPALDATAALPCWIQHADVTLTNVLADGGDVTGVVDFGDMHHTAAACDLAVALTAVLRNTAAEQPAGTWELVVAVLDGYQRHRLLEPEEAAVLGELVLARLGVTEAISAQRVDEHADNRTYITQYDEANRRLLEELSAIPAGELARRIGRMAGTSRVLTGRPGVAQAATVTDQQQSSETVAVTNAPGSLLDRRHRVMAGTLSPLFYRRPLHVVRGQGPWLFTADGRRLLDAYNNVAVVGHSHPVVTQSVSRQLALLNTHSRYLHSTVVELAERILATMPDALDTCLFTTSGTEANELAWRLATAYTGGRGAMVVEHAYHGSTKWMADLSPSEWPSGYRPEHVATFEAPHGLGADTGGDGGQAVAEQRVADSAERLSVSGDRPALLLADSLFTSEGILDAPTGFFHGLLAGAHSADALYLADEVQAGYGRTGPQMWRFALAGVVPDMVSLGKPMGAGYPIGALVTRRDIAATLARDYEYFSTFAATPVAAAAGLAVLDVLQDGDVPTRAAAVGEHLRARLRDLAAAHPALGQVRGTGLVAGVDLHAPAAVPDAREWAKDVLNALVDEGVMAGLTGPTGTVLKVRPPLIWTEEHAGALSVSLHRALLKVSRQLTPDTPH